MVIDKEKFIELMCSLHEMFIPLAKDMEVIPNTGVEEYKKELVKEYGYEWEEYAFRESEHHLAIYVLKRLGQQMRTFKARMEEVDWEEVAETGVDVSEIGSRGKEAIAEVRKVSAELV
ncbi:MAG: hypothetical protein ACXABY_32085, partial [Candidatus Thorarchaeota archaeon]